MDTTDALEAVPYHSAKSAELGLEPAGMDRAVFSDKGPGEDDPTPP
jgi:hypothetical protein